MDLVSRHVENVTLKVKHRMGVYTDVLRCQYNIDRSDACCLSPVTRVRVKWHALDYRHAPYNYLLIHCNVRLVSVMWADLGDRRAALHCSHPPTDDIDYDTITKNIKNGYNILY